MLNSSQFVLNLLLMFLVELYIGSLRNKIKALTETLNLYNSKKLKPAPEGTEVWEHLGPRICCYYLSDGKVILRIDDEMCTSGDIYRMARWLDGIYCGMKGIDPKQLCE